MSKSDAFWRAIEYINEAADKAINVAPYLADLFKEARADTLAALMAMELTKQVALKADPDGYEMSLLAEEWATQRLKEYGKINA